MVRGNAELPHLCGIVFRLHGQKVEGGKHGAKKPGKSVIALKRTGRYASIDEHGGNVVLVEAKEPMGPKIGFHLNEEIGANAVQVIGDHRAEIKRCGEDHIDQGGQERVRHPRCPSGWWR